jgi:hypothetical protein
MGSGIAAVRHALCRRVTAALGRYNRRTGGRRRLSCVFRVPGPFWTAVYRARSWLWELAELGASALPTPVARGFIVMDAFLFGGPTCNACHGVAHCCDERDMLYINCRTPDWSLLPLPSPLPRDPVPANFHASGRHHAEPANVRQSSTLVSTSTLSCLIS